MAQSTPEIVIINVNTGQNKNSKADDRKTTLKQILTSQAPSIVFTEEFTWKRGLHKGAFKDFGIPDGYDFLGNEDSGFIYDSSDIDCVRLDLNTSVRSIYEGLKSVFDLPRLCICKLKSKGPPEFELIGVCWHGPHNNVSDETKKIHLRSLLKFLLKVKVEFGNLPLMLGGDFNLDSEEVRKVCSEVSPCLVVKAPHPSIMMWVYSNDFENTASLGEEKQLQYPAYDHDVSKMKMEILRNDRSTLEKLIYNQETDTNLTWEKGTERETIGFGDTEQQQHKHQEKREKETEAMMHPNVHEKTVDFEYCLSIRRSKKERKTQMIRVEFNSVHPEESKEESVYCATRLLMKKINEKALLSENEFTLNLHWILKDFFQNGAWGVIEPETNKDKAVPFEPGTRNQGTREPNMFGVKMTIDHLLVCDGKEKFEVSGYFDFYGQPDENH